MGAPMGGIKDSGLGRRHGAEGMLKYTESQNIASSLISPIIPPPNVPVELAQKAIPRLLKMMKYVPGVR
jgi:succinate-semialdehyde dehydrogenase/glutarate-semialdehyde dehydrogenase